MNRWDKRPYIQRLGDSLSQFANVLLLNGMTDESISGRSYRNTVLRERQGLPVAWRWVVIRWLAEALFWPIDRAVLQHVQHVCSYPALREDQIMSLLFMADGTPPPHEINKSTILLRMTEQEIATWRRLSRSAETGSSPTPAELLALKAQAAFDAAGRTLDPADPGVQGIAAALVSAGVLANPARIAELLA